jgi:flagellin-like hook-associated protein FlgL
MPTSKRLLRLLALSFGLLGFVGCSLALVGVWRVGARLRQATEAFFEKVETTAVVVQSRLVQTRERLDASKVTADGMAQSLKDWAGREAVERLALRLDAERRTERMASALQQGDHWLEVSGSSVELIQRALSMASSAGAPVDPTAVDAIVEEIAHLQSRLAEATDFVSRIREWTAEASGGKPLNQRIKQAAELAVRVASTLGAVDSRLDKLADRFSQFQENLRELRVKTLRRIWLGTIAVMLLVLWMGAGQVALSLYGCRGLGRGRTGQTPCGDPVSEMGATQR